MLKLEIRYQQIQLLELLVEEHKLEVMIDVQQVPTYTLALQKDSILVVEKMDIHLIVH